MIKIDTEQSRTLTFELGIEGTDIPPENVRLVFEGINSSELSFKGIVENNKAKVEIPILSEFVNLFENDIVKSNLSLEIEGKQFKPWEGEFQMKKPIHVVAEKKDDPKVTQVSVSEEIEESVKDNLPIKQKVEVIAKPLTIEEKFIKSLKS